MARRSGRHAIVNAVRCVTLLHVWRCYLLKHHLGLHFSATCSLLPSPLFCTPSQFDDQRRRSRSSIYLAGTGPEHGPLASNSVTNSFMSNSMSSPPSTASAVLLERFIHAPGREAVPSFTFAGKIKNKDMEESDGTPGIDQVCVFLQRGVAISSQ